MVSWLRCVVLLCALSLAACASFPYSPNDQNILPLHDNVDGFCTAWAVSPQRWITASHCIPPDGNLEFFILDHRMTVVAFDDTVDLAMLSGGPSVRPLKVARHAPTIGDEVYVMGYGGTNPLLLFFKGNLLSNSVHYFEELNTTTVVVGATGMPGMSGGPLLVHGEVIGALVGGGHPAQFRQLMIAAVPWASLVKFIKDAPTK